MGFLSSLFGKKAVAEVERSSFDDLQPFRRQCWLPIVSDGDGAVTASKFAGIPYLRQGESWPECPNCNKPIQLFLQLNSEELPANAGKPWGDGLLQFFYCTNTDPQCEVELAAWDAFVKSVLIRVVPAGDLPSAYESSPVEGAFPPKLITGWSEADDLPSAWTELQRLGVELSEEDAEELSETYPRAGEKLMGWPYWVQDVEYPDCPECDSEMQLVFQIDSWKSIPFLFGDAGVGHIAQCPEHRTTMAFRWACS